MTKLQAFEAALKSGKIGISRESAEALAKLARLDEAVDGIYDMLADRSDVCRSNEIYDELYTRYGAVRDYAFRMVGEAIIGKVFERTEFSKL